MRWLLALATLLTFSLPSFAQQVGPGGVPGAGGGGIIQVSMLPGTCTAGAQYQLPSGYVATCGPGNTFVNNTGTALDPRQFGADFNGHFVGDASTTSGSNVVTCPNSDCNFPSNVAGYIVFATNYNGACGTNGSIPSIMFGGAAQTTVTGYTNANSITVSGNSDTTATGTTCLAWFPKDSTTALTNWWNAGGCSGSYVLPAGMTLFSAPIMQQVAGCSAPSTVNGYEGQTVKGSGVGTTFLIPSPTFTYTSIVGTQNTNCAVGNANVEHEEGFTVFGLGVQAPSSLNACLFMVGAASSAFRVDLEGWDSSGGGTSLIGVNVIGPTDTFTVGGVNYFGTIGLNVSGSFGVLLQNNFVSGSPSGTCGVILGGGVFSQNNYYAIGCVEVGAGSAVSDGDEFVEAGNPCIYVEGAVLSLRNAIASDCGTGMFLTTSGATVSLIDSAINGITGTSGATFSDLGGNTITGTVALNGMTWPLNTSQPFALTAGSITGCGTVTSPSGSGTSGTFNAGATSCAPVITTGIAAKHGYVCTAQDLTTPADTLKAASSTTTTCTFASSTVVSGDTIQFQAVPF